MFTHQSVKHKAIWLHTQSCHTITHTHTYTRPLSLPPLSLSLFLTLSLCIPIFSHNSSEVRLRVIDMSQWLYVYPPQMKEQGNGLMLEGKQTAFRGPKSDREGGRLLNTHAVLASLWIYSYHILLNTSQRKYYRPTMATSREVNRFTLTLNLYLQTTSTTKHPSHPYQKKEAIHQNNAVLKQHPPLHQLNLG